ncbi:hypothetical protein ATCC90586_011835 [Pythium insidiosum]|nr:hypothetical protein ATCC90586_011835 [Pythium insidiosum]
MMSTATIKINRPQDAVHLFEAAQHETLIAIAEFYVFAFGVTPPKYHELGHNPCTFSASTSSVGVASLSLSQTPEQEPELETDMKIYRDTDMEMKRSASDAPLPCACGRRSSTTKSSSSRLRCCKSCGASAAR